MPTYRHTGEWTNTFFVGGEPFIVAPGELVELPAVVEHPLLRLETAPKGTAAQRRAAAQAAKEVAELAEAERAAAEQATTDPDPDAPVGDPSDPTETQE